MLHQLGRLIFIQIEGILKNLPCLICCVFDKGDMHKWSIICSFPNEFKYEMAPGIENEGKRQKWSHSFQIECVHQIYESLSCFRQFQIVESTNEKKKLCGTYFWNKA